MSHRKLDREFLEMDDQYSRGYQSTVAFAMSRYVTPLLEAGRLEMTVPDKPRSRKQRFVAKK